MPSDLVIERCRPSAWNCRCGYRAVPSWMDHCSSCYADRKTGNRQWAKLPKPDFRPGGEDVGVLQGGLERIQRGPHKPVNPGSNPGPATISAELAELAAIRADLEPYRTVYGTVQDAIAATARGTLLEATP